MQLRRTFSIGQLIAALLLSGAAAAQDTSAPPRYGTADLGVGFSPDPHVADVQAGGSDAASSAFSDCPGFMSFERPDYNLNYQAGQYGLVIYVDGSEDTTLVVNDPSGAWYCNDDFSEAGGRNPGLLFGSPLSGNYNIWVGSYDSGSTPHVRLLISENAPTWGDVQIGGEMEWGDDSGEYANDGQCDDPRFSGAGMGLSYSEEHRYRDATDCRSLYEQGQVALAEPESVPDTEAVPDQPEQPGQDEGPTLSKTGTGFFVSSSGHLLTNHHVIKGCRFTGIKAMGEPVADALVVSINELNDLALLKTDIHPPAMAAFRGGASVRQGEEVVVYGFPHYGSFSSQGNLTNGLITALSGLQDDLSHLQISAPVQAGNSGGPLMDRSGNIVGMIVSKADSVKIAEYTGEIVQNVNFAIQGSVARSFLDTNNVDYEVADSDDSLAVADIGERAQDFTVLILCYE